jgi:hypothetical protein
MASLAPDPSCEQFGARRRVQPEQRVQDRAQVIEDRQLATGGALQPVGHR